MNKYIKTQTGVVLLLTMFILSGILIITLGAAELVFAGVRMNRLTGYSSVAFFAAEAGLEKALWEVRQNSFPLPGADQLDLFVSPTLDNNSSYKVNYFSSIPKITFKSIGSYFGAKRSVEGIYSTGVTTTCIPSCPGDCGSDGCRGSCGICSIEETCVAGFCEINPYAAFAITVSSTNTGGAIDPLGTTVVNYHDDLVVGITPDVGFDVASFVVDGEDKGSITSYIFDDIRANHTVSVTFKIRTFNITTSVSLGGTIDPVAAIVDYGSNQTFTIDPDTGYNIASVLVDGVDQGVIDTYTFNNVLSDHTISATFVLKKYIILALADPNGSISPSGSVVVDYGTDQIFTITPNFGYNIASVLVDGADRGAIGTYTFNNIKNDHTISATFILKTYDILASAGPNGSISPSGTVVVNHDSNQTFTITPNADSNIAAVLVDGIDQGAINIYTFNTVQAAHTISAAFVLKAYVVTFNGNTNTGGATPAQTININTTVALTANGFTKTGYTFAGWATTVGGAVAYANQASYTMGTANVTLYAKWTPNNYIVTFNGNTNTGGATPSQTIAADATANLTANGFTKTGYTFAGWATTAGGAVAYANQASYTMGTANVTLYAKWTPIGYVITFNGNTNTGGATPSQTIAADATATLTANGFTKTGYTFAGWATTAGGAVAYANQASYTMGTANVTLYAKWTPNNYIVTFNGNTNTGGATPAQTIAADATATLTANGFTKTGYTFAGWATTAGGAVAYANQASYTMGMANVTLYAKWTVTTYTIIATTGTGGAISPLGTVIVNYGSNQTFTITPTGGYMISQVLVDGVNQGAIGSYPFNNVQANHTISVSFITASQVAYTAPGTYSWVAPAGVARVSVICVGGGGRGWHHNGGNSGSGGGGGGLGYINDYSVTSGNSYTVVVGAGGTLGVNGGDSYFVNATTVRAGGGVTSLGPTGGAGGGRIGTGGGNGGVGGDGNTSATNSAGGGGAGGYSGNGGAGGNTQAGNGLDGAGGGAGGGGASGGGSANQTGGAGGGVGLLGLGSNGTGGNGGTPNPGAGTGGSGGANGSAGTPGNYGGGSGGTGANATQMNGAGGACRIIWPGNFRSFPSTGMADQ